MCSCFYRDAESFCDCSHFICGGLWFIDCLPYMYKENEAVVFDVEEDTKIRQEKLDGLVIYNIFSKQSRGYRDLNVIRVFGMTPSI